MYTSLSKRIIMERSLKKRLPTARTREYQRTICCETNCPYPSAPNNKH